MDLSSSETHRRLTAFEIVGIVLTFLSILFVVPRAFLTYIIRFRLLSTAGISVQQHIFAAVSRWFLSLLNDHQLQVLQARNYGHVVKKLLKMPQRVSKNVEYLEPVIGQGFRGFWIAKTPEFENPRSKLLIWLHGGGYAIGDAKTFFPVLLDLYEKLEDASCPTSIFFLEYSLSPKAKYPTQLRQAAEAYRYIVDELNISPSRITIGGDSAGGNLTLQLFRHIIEPHPDISITFSTSYKPAKCILVSPWLSLDHSSGGFVRNKDNDGITMELLERCAFNWRGNYSDIFTDPLKASYISWANILPSTMVVSGDRELFIDDIVEFCEKLKKSGCKLIEDHRKGKLHDWWWLEPSMLGFENPRAYECNERLRDFIADRM